MPRKQFATSVTFVPPPPSATRKRDPKYIPPADGSCPVNTRLPPELLAHIFELGTRGEEKEIDQGEEPIEEDDGDEAYSDVDSEEDDADIDEEEIWQPQKKAKDEEKMEVDADAAKTKGNAMAKDATSKKIVEVDPLAVPFQVRMSHVCRHWRNVALNTPALWKRITFTDDPPFEQSAEWIRRSKGVPLDILIDLSELDENLAIMRRVEDAMEAAHPEDVDAEVLTPEEEDARAEEESAMLVRIVTEDLTMMLDLIIPHVERWRLFELIVDEFQYMHLALVRLADCRGAPMLEELNLHNMGDTVVDEDDYEQFTPAALKAPLLPFSGITPRLENVQLWGTHVDWNFLLPPDQRASTSVIPKHYLQPTTPLRSLDLAYHAKDVRPSVDQFIKLLKGAPNLASLDLSASGPNIANVGGPIIPINLQSLKHLKLAYIEQELATFLLKLFHIPALDSFHIDLEDDDFSPFLLQLAGPMPQLPDAPLIVTHGNEVKKPPSIVASITGLKVSGLHCSDEAVLALYRTTRLVHRLFLNMNFLPLAFFTFLINPESRTRRVELGDEDGHPQAFDIAPVEIPLSFRTTRAGVDRVLLPYLEELTVSGMKGEDIVALVRSRKAAGHPVKRLLLDQEDVLTVDESDWLEKNVESVDYVEISDDEAELLITDDDNESLEFDMDLEEDEEEEDDEDEDEEIIE